MTTNAMPTTIQNQFAVNHSICLFLSLLGLTENSLRVLGHGRDWRSVHRNRQSARSARLFAFGCAGVASGGATLGERLVVLFTLGGALVARLGASSELSRPFRPWFGIAWRNFDIRLRMPYKSRHKSQVLGLLALISHGLRALFAQFQR